MEIPGKNLELVLKGLSEGTKQLTLLAWNLRDNYFVKVVFLPKFSALLSLGQLANTKQGEQYENYKVSTRMLVV